MNFSTGQIFSPFFRKVYMKKKKVKNFNNTFLI